MTLDMAPSWKEQQELRNAILQQLTKDLNGPRNASNSSAWRLFQEDKHYESTLLEPDDDDWQDVKLGCNDQSLLSNDFIQLYDKEGPWTIYHIEVKSPVKEAPTFESNDDETSKSNRPPLGTGEESTPMQTEVGKVINRLVPGNGLFRAHGYREWMQKKVQARLTVESDIPGYATLCVACENVLTESFLCYRATTSTTKKAANDEPPECKITSEAFSHHSTTRALHVSAREGCHLCSLLDAPEERIPEQDKKKNNTPYHLHIHQYRNAGFLFSIYAVGVGSTVVFCNQGGLSTEPSTLRYANTISPAITRLARTWLARCLEEDKETCATSPEFLPSRLIKVIMIDDSLSVRLVLRDEVPKHTQYLTLSHCWGKLELVRLLANTMETYRSEIPLSKLSKTFRDALQVTAWLGYQYIWIDSLCIQQDSKSDWEREAATMGEIYRHSTCTIAATGAKDGDGGLFFERSAVAFTACPLFARENGELLYADRGSVWPAPLTTRAWAVQERFLSPRTLSFGSDRVSWNCRRIGSYEGPHAHRMKQNPNDILRMLDPNAEKFQASQAWKSIIIIYSNCELTLWKDKWPAFQGLTNEVAKAQGWKLVHGLRQHMLHTSELLWYTIGPSSETIDLDQPSWSWLNLKSGVYAQDDDICDFYAEVAVEESCPSNITKKASGNVLRIKTCIAKLKPDYSEVHLREVDCKLAVTNPLYEMHSSTRFLSGYWYPDSFPVSDGDLWALQIGGFSLPDSMGRYYHKGLVIVAAKNNPGFWRRVGQYTVWSTSNSGGEVLSPWRQEKSTILLI
jgi:hypothetical protein